LFTPADLHSAKNVYIATMLATPELIREAGQIPQLEELLPRWRDVPLYRNSLARTGRGRAGFERFKSLPLLAKHEMRNGFPRNFLSGEQSLESLLEKNLVELEHTSGTSEERLPVIFGRGWWNAQEERALRLNGFVARVLDEHPAARRATLVPPACNGLTCPTVWMSREQRTLGNTLFVNLARIPFLLGDADLARMAAEIAEWSPQFLDMDPVHGVRFALYCEENGIQFPSLRFVLCSYEFVSVVHRRILERVFNVPVFNLYGSTETGHLLMENERGEMKPSYDTAFLEIVDADERGIGELVVTTLTNDYMPLLRYRIGDLAERIERPYGNNFVVHGRSRDALTAGDGRRVTTWQVDQCFAGADGIAHYELRQEKNGDHVLRFVPDGTGPGEKQLDLVSSRLHTLLGLHNTIKTEAMPVLVPAASGKFRLTHYAAKAEK
jgi:phenylacetate-coenzyme A ligase PaaK-like adenylate-forming protein